MSKTTVKITLDNTDNVLRAVSGKTLMQAAKAGGEVIRNYARINAERVFSGKSRGELAGSIQVVEKESGNTKASVDIGPTVIYGRIQELGGLIRPVFAKMLSWVGDDGIRIFAKFVQLLPHPYLQPAVDEHLDDIKDAIGYHLRAGIEAATK